MPNCITACFYLLLVICSANAIKPIKRVVVDVDAGIDDFHALVVLFNADHRGEIKIEAITCSFGNTELEHVKNNVVRLLETIGRTDVPVYAGSYLPIIPQHPSVLERWYGLDGFGDLEYKRSSHVEIINNTISPTFFNSILLRHPKEITVVIVGPSTNLGLALRMYKHLPDLIKEIFIMGGAYEEDRVEFNILGDPEAAKIVFETPKCPITILPWEACSNKDVTLEWRFGLNLNNPVWNLAERAERSQFSNKWPSMYRTCDMLLAMAFVNPHKVIAKQSKHFVEIDLNGKEKGRLLLTDAQKTGKEITIIQKVDTQYFKKAFKEEFVEICKNRICHNFF